MRFSYVSRLFEGLTSDGCSLNTLVIVTAIFSDKIMPRFAVSYNVAFYALSRRGDFAFRCVHFLLLSFRIVGELNCAFALL